MVLADEGAGDILENITESASVNLNPSEVKDKRKEYDVKRGKSRINLYEQFIPWTELKNELNFDTHKELAGFLINAYMSGRNTAVKWYVKIKYYL